MHPIVSHAHAWTRMEDLHREAELARRARAVPTDDGRSLRLALARRALRIAERLDRDHRIVPTAPAH